MKLHLLLFCCVYALVYIPAFAQDFETDYKPLATSSQTSAMLQSIQRDYERDIEKLPKENNKELKEQYTERYENLVAEIKAGAVITDTKVTDYFDNILKEILAANPDIRSRNVRLLIYRSEAPNASCLGEGTLYLNLGLINRFENESQIAFTVCHELAHLTKNHVNTAIRKTVNHLYSKETQAELKRIEKEEYRKVSQAMALLKGYVYDARKHSRLHEEEADAVGLAYLKNTKYDATAALSMLEILDKVELFKYQEEIALQEKFDFSPDYPFKERWLKPEDKMTFGEQEDKDWNKDSLKTHPDCQKRIGLLKTLLAEYEPADRVLFAQSEADFEYMKTVSDFEIVAEAYEYRNLDLCIFYSLQLLKKYPKNAYLHATLGKAFYLYFRARHDHKGSNYVSKPDEDYGTAYEAVAIFLNNLRTSEISKVGYYYVNNQDAALLSYEEFFYAYLLSLKMTGNAEELMRMKKRFLETFPKSEKKQIVEEMEIFEK